MSSIAAMAATARKLTMEPGHDARAKKSMRSVSTYIQKGTLFHLYRLDLSKLKFADFGSTGSPTGLGVSISINSGLYNNL